MAYWWDLLRKIGSEGWGDSSTRDEIHDLIDEITSELKALTAPGKPSS